MPALIDLTGRKFSRWTVQKRSGTTRNGEPLWRCLCDCSIRRNVSGQNLRNGTSQSCGCLHIDKLQQSRSRNFKHGDIKVVDGRLLCTKEYWAWCGMKMRCHNKKFTYYKNYGGRGITMCRRWRDSYLNFLQDMKRAPSPDYSIDRINNNGNYTSKNCCWATKKQQVDNRRKRRVV